jgi:hypothetical protein
MKLHPYPLFDGHDLGDLLALLCAATFYVLLTTLVKGWRLMKRLLKPRFFHIGFVLALSVVWAAATSCNPRRYSGALQAGNRFSNSTRDNPCRPRKGGPGRRSTASGSKPRSAAWRLSSEDQRRGLHGAVKGGFGQLAGGLRAESHVENTAGRTPGGPLGLARQRGVAYLF